jgi:hypothetical protein
MRCKLTTFQVNNAITLMMPCAKPKKIDTGRNTMSQGFRRNKPIRLTALVKRYQIVMMIQPKLRESGLHDSEAKWYVMKKNGSVTSPRERKVAV